jgi:hypothetical protein
MAWLVCQTMRIVRLTIGTSVALLAGFAALALLIVWLSVPNRASADSATPAAVAVRGYVYYDRNDNGVRDPGEPGLADISIHDGSAKHTTLTGADGGYALTALPKSGYLQVETGWFRSQCPPPSSPTANSCAAGPGKDNDFKVDNQFVRYTLTSKSVSNINVGLLPDWPGRSMTIPAPAGGIVPANAVDVAARLSWASGDCTGGSLQICRAGDAFTMDGQVLNQGTTALTGIRARVYVPPGDCATGAALLAYTMPSGLGDLTMTPAVPDCSTRYLDLSLAGALAPAADVRIRISGRTASGPGTPGCAVTKPNKSRCPSEEPQGRGWLFGVGHIDQYGDPDSTFCADGDMTLCPLGLHDKRRAPDEIDPAGHNVDAALGGSTSYDLSARVQLLDMSTVRAWLGNVGPTASPQQVQVKIWLPAGTAVLTVPPKHNLITCDNGQASSGAVVVTCTLGGPVGPTLSSPAIDLTLGALPTRVVVCAATPSGAPIEAVPAGAGCGFTTDATATPTNNDTTLVP